MPSAGSGEAAGLEGDSQDLIILGRISGLYGIKGWVRVYSHTEPRENILKYAPWRVRENGAWKIHQLDGGRRHGKGVVARLADIDNRDDAAALMGADIAVLRKQLGSTEPGEYFWSDLEGMEVVTTGGEPLGVIDHLFETGANDVMVVKGQRTRLIPFVEPECVVDVDLSARRVLVDWDADF